MKSPETGKRETSLPLKKKEEEERMWKGRTTGW